MKKWITFLLTATLVLGLAACSKTKPSQDDVVQTSSGDNFTDDTTEAPTETAPTENELEQLRKEQAEISWALDDQGVLTVSGTGAMPDYTMRTADNDIGFTTDSPWFERRSEICSIVVEEGITYIGEWAFSACDNLEQLSISSTVVGMGMGCLNGNGLQTLEIPDNVKYLSEGMFAGSDSLERVSIGSGVTALPYSLFYKCKNLEEVQLSEGLSSIGHDTFYGCHSLRTIHLPQTLTYIGESAFCECYRLYEITLPQSLTGMGESCFYRCGLQEVVIPDGVKKIPVRAFSGCELLRELTLPAGLEMVGHSAFSGCDALSEIAYDGTAEDWAHVQVESKYNETFLSLISKELQYGEDEPVKLVLNYHHDGESDYLDVDYLVPMLQLEGPDVERINQEINDKIYVAAQEGIAELEDHGYSYQGDIWFSYKIRGDVLSLMINSREFETVLEDYYVYNVSLSEGTQLSREDFLATFDMTVEQYRNRARKVINDCIDTDHYYVEGDYRERTLSDENLDAALLYLNEGGELAIIFTLYVPAGSGYQYIRMPI